MKNSSKESLRGYFEGQEQEFVPPPLVAGKRPIKRRRPRTNADQLLMFQEAFILDPIPSLAFRESIGSLIELSQRSVQVWFQNVCYLVPFLTVHLVVETSKIKAA